NNNNNKTTTTNNNNNNDNNDNNNNNNNNNNNHAICTVFFCLVEKYGWSCCVFGVFTLKIIHTHMHTHTYTCIHTHTHTHTYTHIHTLLAVLVNRLSSTIWTHLLLIFIPFFPLNHLFISCCFLFF
ncbi:hypothetical protein LOAG_12176, partial [Loa loa]